MISYVVFICQLSLTLNAGFNYSGLNLFQEAFNNGAPKASVSQMLMLVLFSVNCELRAPGSEESRSWGVLASN